MATGSLREKRLIRALRGEGGMILSSGRSYTLDEQERGGALVSASMGQKGEKIKQERSWKKRRTVQQI